MKYRVYGLVAASVVIGEYEAENEEEAEKMADQDDNADWHPSLCHECGHEIDLGDVYKTQVEKV